MYTIGQKACKKKGLFTQVFCSSCNQRNHQAEITISQVVIQQLKNQSCIPYKLGDAYSSGLR